MLKEISKKGINKSQLKKLISKEIMEGQKIIDVFSSGIVTFTENGKKCREVEWNFQCKDLGIRDIKIKEYDGENPIITFYDYEKNEYISKEESKKRYNHI